MAQKPITEDKTSIARVIAVTSGRKGVGKTNIAASFAVVLAKLGNHVTLIDMDLGTVCANMLMDITPEHDIGDVINESKSLDSVITRTPYNVDVINGISGDDSLKNLSEQQQENIVKVADSLCHNNNYIIIDTKAGASYNTTVFTSTADEVIVVTTTDPEAVVDAYAAIKLIKQSSPQMVIHLIINMAKSENDAMTTMERIESIAKQFMDGHFEEDGYIPMDKSVVEAETHHQPFVVYDPASTASRALTGITNIITNMHTSPLYYESGEQNAFFVRLISKL